MSHSTSQVQDPDDQPIQNSDKPPKRERPARKERGKTKSAPAPSEKQMKALAARAEKIREHDQGILKAEKSSMAMALAAGESLLWGKQELKRLGIRKKFQTWIEVDCKIKYPRAYNYMKLVAAATKDPSIKNLGLTEAYLQLRLVTRKEKMSENGDGKSESSDAGATQDSGNSDGKFQSSDGAQNGGSGTTVPAQHRRIGALEVERRNDVYVLEIDAKSNWQDSLLDALGDIENFTAVLADGGLLIRLKPDAQAK